VVNLSKRWSRRRYHTGFGSVSYLSTSSTCRPSVTASPAPSASSSRRRPYRRTTSIRGGSCSADEAPTTTCGSGKPGAAPLGVDSSSGRSPTRWWQRQKNMSLSTRDGQPTTRQLRTSGECSSLVNATSRRIAYTYIVSLLFRVLYNI